MGKLWDWAKAMFGRKQTVKEVRSDIDLFLKSVHPRFRGMWRTRMRRGLSDQEAIFVAQKIRELRDGRL